MLERKNAVLISIHQDTNEICQLMHTLNYVPMKIVTQRRRLADSKTYIGNGKLMEINEYINNETMKIDAVVINGDLKPNQHYNIETVLKRPIYDRQGLILEIFKSRAHNKEAALQVELASYIYEIPFVREWIHRMHCGDKTGFMSGGVYRTADYLTFIRRRMSKIKEELKAIDKQNEAKRKSRERAGIVTVSIAGYTNAGKTSLLNILTKTVAVTADEYFTTLQTKTKSYCRDTVPIIITDTVGFIKDVPAWFISSFRPTLSEIWQSDIILVVLDSSTNLNVIMERYNVTLQNLRTVNTSLKSNKKMIVIFNKCDLIETESLNEKITTFKEYTGIGAIAVSTKTGYGITKLEELIKATASQIFHEKRCPPSQMNLDCTHDI